MKTNGYTPPTFLKHCQNQNLLKESFFPPHFNCSHLRQEGPFVSSPVRRLSEVKQDMVTVLFFINVPDQVTAIGNVLLLDPNFSTLAARWNHMGSFQNC